MPVIKSAEKKLRKDKKRTIHNRKIKEAVKKAIKQAKIKKTESIIRKAISLVNKASKKNIIHKNKASRLTSMLSKLIAVKKTSKNAKTKKEVEKK